MKTVVIISNLIGLIALSCWTYSLQKNDKKQIMKFQLLANTFYAIQYIVIGATAAGMMNIISVIRYSVYYKIEEKGEKIPAWVFGVFVISIITVGVINYKTVIDIIPIVITLLYTYITWQKNTRVIRYGVIFAAIIWIYYNFSVQAYITIIGNILEILSGLIAEYRFNIKKEKRIKT